MPTPAKKPVHEAIDDIMQEIDFIAKSQTNTQQGFNFRGIDDVKIVVDPLLRKHHVGVGQKELKSVTREWYKTSRGTDMTNVTVEVIWEWTGPDGSTKTYESAGEAADTGDKAVSKAQSVAKKVMFIDVLNIPVAPGEIADPDADAHRRAGQPAVGTTVPPMPSARPSQPAAQLGLPSERQWEAEAIELVNRGLALVTTDLEAAKRIVEQVIALYKEADSFRELTPALNRKITGHGSALRAAINKQEQANRRRRPPA